MDLMSFVFAEKSQADLNFYDYDVTIAGKRGSGKTTLAIELYKDDCCVIDVENGAKSFGGIYKVTPKTWKELKSIAKDWGRAIKKGARPPFSVLLFDTQTKLQLMCQEHVLDENGWDDFTQGADGVNRWTVLKNEYTSLMDEFKRMGFKIVRICHGKDKVFKPRGQEPYNQYAADVGATFDYDVLGAVDFVFYLEKVRVTDDDGGQHEARRLVLQNDLDYDVKCRFPELPDEIIYDEVADGVKQFYKEWDKAVNKKAGDEVVEDDELEMVFATKDPEPIRASQPDKPTVVEPELSLEDLHEQAVAIRDKMLSGGTERAEMITLLKDELGTASINKCTDKDKLKAFIAKYE